MPILPGFRRKNPNTFRVIAIEVNDYTVCSIRILTLKNVRLAAGSWMLLGTSIGAEPEIEYTDFTGF